jgi:uncharacterized repeat protein (TIGR02543 family)
MNRKIISLLLCLVMLIGMLPVSAFADEESAMPESAIEENAEEPQAAEELTAEEPADTEAPTETEEPADTEEATEEEPAGADEEPEIGETFLEAVTYDMMFAAASFDASSLNGIPATANAGGTTGWISEGDVLRSNNKGKSNSKSTLTLTFTDDAEISFMYKVSSETRWDTFTISHNGTAIVNGISGETDWAECHVEVKTGDVMTFVYSKDVSGDKNDDCAYLTGFSCAESVEITYHANGGSGNDYTQKVFGTTTLSPNAFTKDHAVFEGWSTTPDGEVVYTDGQSIEKPESAMELYAQWSEAHKVSFDYTGSYVNIKDGQPLGEGNVPTPSRIGYTFDGWSVDGEKLDPTAPVTKDILCTADWTPITYIIRFEPNNGSGTMSEINLDYDKSINLPECGFARNGYSFIGWGTSSYSSTATYMDEERVENLCNKQGQVITLYALWAGNSIDITVDLNYETENRTSKRLGVVGKSYNYTYDEVTGKSQYDKLSDPVREGYIFDGWFDAATDGNQITSYTYFEDDTPVTMYAHWTKSVTISFNSNGGSCYTSSKQIPLGSAYGSLPTASKSGSAFEGWFTAAEGGEQVDSGTVFNEDTVLYAHYRNYRYTLKFNANGGQGEMDSMSCESGVEYTLPLCSFTREGYNFKGWSSSYYSSTVTYDDGATIKKNVSSDNSTTNLYALWEETIFNKAFNAVSSALPSDGIVRSIGSLNLPTSGTGYTISYESSTSYIDGQDVLRLPDSGSYAVTITATVTDTATGETQSKAFDLLMYSDEAAQAESYLKEAANSLTKNFTPVYGTDTNANTAIEAILKDNGYEGITVSVKERAGNDNASIETDGTINYYFSDSMSGSGSFYTSFVLSKDGAQVTKEYYTKISWDLSKVEAKLNEIAETISLPSEPITELTLPRYTIKDGVDASNVDYTVYSNFNTWATVTWTSADNALVQPGSAPSYPYYAPYSTTVTRSAQNESVQLTATITFNNADVSVQRNYTVTVKGNDADSLEQLRKELEATLNQGYATYGLRDFATGTQVDTDNVTGDLQLVTARELGLDGSKQPVKIYSSNENVIKTTGINNGTRVWVYQPLPGEQPVTVTLTATITDKETGVTASKYIKVTVQPMDSAAIQAEIALMEQVKASYFDGIKGDNTSQSDITTNLHAFQEAYLDDSGNLVWVYNYSERTGTGIIPVDIDGWENQEQWRLFKSSNAQVINHENLIVTRDTEHKLVTVTSYLSSETYGKYAELYPDNELFAALYKQPVSVELTVTGTNPTTDTPKDEKFSVSFTIEDNGTYWYSCQVKNLTEGSTAYDALTQALSAGGYGVIGGGSFVSGIVCPDGTVLKAMDRGDNSGWMYSVNGATPSVSLNQYYLKAGDSIVFYYTDDYTKTYGSSKVTAQDVEKLIAAIGKVTVNSGDQIQKAREAYNNLSSEEQAKVSNLAVLEEAERIYARLISGKAEKYLDIYKAVGDYIEQQQLRDIDSFGCEWLALGLSRAEREVPEEYYKAIEKYVADNINAASQLSERESTQNSRLILALTAMNKDVTNVAGYNLLQGLSDMDYIEKQGISALVYALIALDSGNYEVPTVPEGGRQTSREALIEAILDKQLEDGGWAFSGEKSEADITAMVLQALASYYSSDKEVKLAADKAVELLSELQTNTGGYTSGGVLNSESAAQVVVALTALGIDPYTDSRFIKNDVSVLDSLCSFYIDGGFSHLVDGKQDELATTQGFYALCAYYRFANDKTSLYDMSDVEPDVSSAT